MKKNVLTPFGLKWNPFSPEVPTQACLVTSKVESFCVRVENLARDGGFALLSGDPGIGKSVALRILVERLSRVRDLMVGILTRPQGSLADFYRELGDLFGVQLAPHNRWAGSKALRERWFSHIQSSLHRAVLVVDEAQQMQTSVLSELRLLAATDLDSRSLLTVVLAGDGRILEKFRTEELLPLGTRMRVRLTMEVATPDELAEHLRHTIAEAGNPRLMTPELVRTLCDHAAGNLRVLMGLAAELLDAGLARDLRQLDEKLFFDVFASTPPAATKPRKAEPKTRVQ